MRVLFVATGDIALPAFRCLLATDHRPLALVTQPDKPAGRRMKPTAPRIKTEALAAGIPVYQPERIGDATAELAALEPDLVIVAAYGQILRKGTLELPRRAIINLHASLLPKYRGAACIQAAIDAGDAESGVTSMHVVRELDAGDIILTRRIPIAPDETGGSLHDKLADLAADVLVETISRMERGTDTRTPQDPALVSYIPKLDRADGRIDWNRSAAAIERRVRAYDPWPGTYTTVEPGGKRLKIFPPTRVLDLELAPGSVATDGGRLIVGCGTGALELLEVQPDGGRRIPAADYLRGRKPAAFA